MQGAGGAGEWEEEQQGEVQLQGKVQLQPPGVGGEGWATAYPSADTWLDSNNPQPVLLLLFGDKQRPENPKAMAELAAQCKFNLIKWY